MKHSLPNPILGARFISALALAVEWHATQPRKGNAIPYVSHLLAVCAAVLEFGGNEDEAISALLHDAIEDASTAAQAADREATIREVFGESVVSIVLACTDGRPDPDGRKASWEERKQPYVVSLDTKSASALLVIACDKLHNLTSLVRDLRRDGLATLKRFRANADQQRWYFAEIGRVLVARRIALATEYGAMLGQFKELTR